jgi:hypothetical protein
MPGSAPQHPLGIFMPAYKAGFLREALRSLARQTDQRFQLYIGDDASPEPVAEIAREFQGSLRAQYRRFDQNLGGTSLVQHWERCLRLGAEPWVWLFSDDDLLDPGCVAAFYAELERSGGRHDLYRFNTIWLNDARQERDESAPHPAEESGADFLAARLRGGRRSTFQELVFSRAAWQAAGGIPDFPLAWASDDAFIATLGARCPIKCISGPRVTWRWGEASISGSSSAATFRTKLRASEEFIRWAMAFLEQHPPSSGCRSPLERRRLTEHWFFDCFVYHAWRFLDWDNCREIERFARHVWGRPPGAGWLRALRANAFHFQRKCADKLQRWQQPRQKSSV